MRVSSSILSGLVGLQLVVACSKNVSVEHNTEESNEGGAKGTGRSENGGSTDGPQGTGGREASPENTTLCGQGSTFCDGSCVDVSTHPKHCGECDSPCGIGANCAWAVCVCFEGYTTCSRDCVDIQSDAGHCGGCGIECASTEVCSRGQCREGCDDGLTQCGNSCVDMLTNEAHCGECDHACSSSFECAEGQCRCPDGLEACSDGCVDLDSNSSNCGACDAECQDAERCFEGACMGTTDPVPPTAGAGAGGAETGSAGAGGAETGGTETGGTETGGAETGGVGTGGAETGGAETGGVATGGASTGGDATGGEGTGGNPTGGTGPGGASNEGWATLGWDCCKPSCAQPEVNPANICNVDDAPLSGNIIDACTSDGATPSAHLCNSFAPWEPDGLEVSYGYAKVADSTAFSCGECYSLQFDGGSLVGSDAGSTAIGGKQMMVQIIGFDAELVAGQFHLMVPGAGVGDAWTAPCSLQWDMDPVSLGPAEGGFYAECTESPASLADAKDCVLDACTNFVMLEVHPELVAGCQWYSSWFEVAQRPTFTYQRLDSCPAELIQRSGMNG